MKNILAKFLKIDNHKLIHIINFENKQDFVIFKYLNLHYIFNYKKKELIRCSYNNFDKIESFELNKKTIFIIDNYCYVTELDYTGYNTINYKSDSKILIQNSNTRSSVDKNNVLINLKNKDLSYFTVIEERWKNNCYLFLIDGFKIFKIKNDELKEFFNLDTVNKNLIFESELVNYKKLFGRKSFEIYYDTVQNNDTYICIEFLKKEMNKKYLICFNKKTKKIIFSEIKKTKNYYVLEFDNKDIIIEKGSYSSEDYVYINSFDNELIINDEFIDNKSRLKRISSLWYMTYFYEDEQYCYYLNKDDFHYTLLKNNNEFVYYRIEKSSFIQKFKSNNSYYGFNPSADILFSDNKLLISIKDLSGYINCFDYKNKKILIGSGVVLCYDHIKKELLDLQKKEKLNIETYYTLPYIKENLYLNCLVNGDPNDYPRKLLSYKLNN